MAYSTTYLYPEDLNGTNPQNLITGETHTLQAPGPKDYYFIIPKAAPFFVDSLRVYNTATGLPYVEGDDYQVGHLFIEAMNSTGRPIAGSIRFMRPTIVGQVTLTYRTLGGPWGFSDQAILRELSNKHLNPLIRSWGDIDVLPYSFPPLPHDQRIDSLVGSQQINETLNKIADILEATAEGTSKSHIDDRNNPHVVTAVQVGLGNVPNFAMATDQQHLDAARNDLFTNPRGVLLLVNKFAVAPLNAHINATGNVHNMVPADIGLGNVPNWRPATPQNAIDPTNNTSFMTPYTTSLLIQKLQNDPRLDQLIIDFNAHLVANNPHHVTPQMIGTYTSAQIDQMIASVSQGGDATTFGGETPEDWIAKFPAVADINEILQQLFDVYLAAVQNLAAVSMDDPVTPEMVAQRNAQRVSWGMAEYEAYAMYNAMSDGIIVAERAHYTGDYPTDAFAGAAGKWSTAQDCAYYVNPNGSVSAWGPNPIAIPAGYGPVGFQTANAIDSIYASKDFLYMYRKGDGHLLYKQRTGNLVDLGEIDGFWGCTVQNGQLDPRPFSIVEAEDQAGTRIWVPYGDASWITAFNAAKATVTAGGTIIGDVRIGTDKLLIMTEQAGNSFLWVFNINYGASITLTNVSATTVVDVHADGTQIFANAVRGITSISGCYSHFVATKPIGPDTTLCDLISFGDNSHGQLDFDPDAGPYLSVVAGYGFTVVVNSLNFAEFLGDSPDNSLLWRNGSHIAVT